MGQANSGPFRGWSRLGLPSLMKRPDSGRPSDLRNSILVRSRLFRRTRLSGNMNKALLAMGNANFGHDRPAVRRIARAGLFYQADPGKARRPFMEGDRRPGCQSDELSDPGGGFSHGRSIQQPLRCLPLPQQRRQAEGRGPGAAAEASGNRAVPGQVEPDPRPALAGGAPGGAHQERRVRRLHWAGGLQPLAARGGDGRDRAPRRRKPGRVSGHPRLAAGGVAPGREGAAPLPAPHDVGQVFPDARRRGGIPPPRLRHPGPRAGARTRPGHLRGRMSLSRPPGVRGEARPVLLRSRGAGRTGC